MGLRPTQTQDMPRRDPRNRRERYSVFLNIPYDRQFENLYLAYIAGLSAFGLIPRATLEIPTSQRRLERILKLIEECTADQAVRLAN